jgi:hypothetical protein
VPAPARKSKARSAAQTRSSKRLKGADASSSHEEVATLSTEAEVDESLSKIFMFAIRVTDGSLTSDVIAFDKVCS